MKVLVDTSVWSLAFSKGADPGRPAVKRLARMLGRDDVVLTGLVLDRAHYVAAARVRRACASAGVSASTADCQIAAAAIEHRCALFTLDRDFERIARHTSLRLLAF